MEFFVLQPSIGSMAETAFEPIDPVLRGEAPRCPSCDLFVGVKPWLPPFDANIYCHGLRVGDVVFGSDPSILVSQRFIDAWYSEGLRGIDTVHQVNVVNVEPDSFLSRIDSYVYPEIVHCGTRLDHRASKIRRGGPITCDLCGGASVVHGIEKLVIDEETWSGEDIFYPWGVNGIKIVSSRVVDLAARNSLENVTVVSLLEFKKDFSVGAESIPVEE